ncbi:hypothetical protein [Bacillus sp. 03113]|uniref:hypothetical protein n=1 Tax=Bacillus sp. 03113 TaxID=2578211 RepID=UPI0011428AF8|nr:hypothetical protein [Bacillus sp. 03113]
MKLKLMLIISLLLLPSSIVSADEGHSNKTDVSKDMEMFMNGEHNDGNSHEGHSMNSGGQEHSTNESGSGEEVGHSHSKQNIKETPPNYKALSVFGAINLLFLVIGFWNKKLRKKVKLDVNTGQKA